MNGPKLVMKNCRTSNRTFFTRNDLTHDALHNQFGSFVESVAMFTTLDVKKSRPDERRVAEIEKNILGFVKMGRLKPDEIIKLAAIALADAENDLLHARAEVRSLRRQLLYKRRNESHPGCVLT
jgi:hypothetical protein